MITTRPARATLALAALLAAAAPGCGSSDQPERGAESIHIEPPRPGSVPGVPNLPGMPTPGAPAPKVP
jgi:hypothetical protein